MKLLQWNIQWCRGMDGLVDPARIARVAKQIADPDVACFQEVAINFPALAGSSGENQVERLCAEFPGYAAIFAAAVEVPDEAGGRRQFGNLILSRLPVRQSFRHTLPWPPGSAPPTMPRVAVDAVREPHIGLRRAGPAHPQHYPSRQRAPHAARPRQRRRGRWFLGRRHARRPANCGCRTWLRR